MQTQTEKPNGKPNPSTICQIIAQIEHDEKYKEIVPILRDIKHYIHKHTVCGKYHGDPEILADVAILENYLKREYIT